MSLEIVQTEGAPAAIGPYSQAVKDGATVYLSGQIALDPETMELVGNDDIDRQTRQVLDNLATVASAAGGDVSRFVKLTIYLTDLTEFAKVNEIMTEYFAPPYPARATIGVAALPKGAAVEIDGIMVL